MIERIHLNIFARIRGEETVTRVAERLNVTQPAITHAVRTLEGVLGTPLWRKKGRTIELTPAGYYLARQAERISADLVSVESHLHDLAVGTRGTLRIGVECHPCFHWLLEKIGPFLEGHPGVDVDIVREYQFSGYEALQHRQIDVLITPDPNEREGIENRLVLPYSVVLATAPDHPLAGRAYANPEDLLQETLYTYPVERHRLDLFTRFLIPAGIEPRQVVVVDTIEVMIAMVAAGRGICAVPDWIVRDSERDLAAILVGKNGIRKNLAVAIRIDDTEPYIAEFAGDL